MIPFRDNIPSRTAPVVTVLLIAINALVFLFELQLREPQRERLIYRYGVIPKEFHPAVLGHGPYPLRVTLERYDVGPDLQVRVRREVETFQIEGTLAGAVIPLFTSMFLHGGWLHLIGNMWFLWLFGDNVEDRVGHARYLVLYLAGGLAAGLWHVFFNWGGLTPTIGASGAVAAVLGAYMVTYPYARVQVFVPFFYFFWPIIELPALVFLLLWFLLELWLGTQTLGRIVETGGVAPCAPVGAFLAGRALVWALAPEAKGRRGPRWGESAYD